MKLFSTLSLMLLSCFAANAYSNATHSIFHNTSIQTSVGTTTHGSEDGPISMQFDKMVDINQFNFGGGFSYNKFLDSDRESVDYGIHAKIGYYFIDNVPLQAIATVGFASNKFINFNEAMTASIGLEYGYDIIFVIGFKQYVDYDSLKISYTDNSTQQVFYSGIKFKF